MINCNNLFWVLSTDEKKKKKKKKRMLYEEAGLQLIAQVSRGH